MRCFLVITLLFFAATLHAQVPRVFSSGALPDDSRLGELRTLNSYFPFKAVQNKQQWADRQSDIKRRILVSQGLWPMPTKTKLNAVVHGRIDYDDYSVQRVYFESIPGHFVTGSLYRPKQKQGGPFPAVLCPHGHWQDARFYDTGEPFAKKSIADGAERFMSAARNHIQARCVQLARMGCVAFFYDMTGNCDSIQLGHRPQELTDRLDTPTEWGYFSAAAELRLQNMMGLQTWNSIRSIDFLTQLPDVDATRIGVTGASGGGTQSMIIAAIDSRITAAMPCVMVSTAMQGGCTCENAPLMRINQGNVDIAAAIAPRPLGLTAADDWTVELETKGFPQLKNLYALLGKKNHLTAAFHTHFKHNYNHVNRTVMYGFFNRHFNLGFEEPILEQDFVRLEKDTMTVWDEDHPAPSGDAIGDSHEIALLKIVTADSDKQIVAAIPTDSAAIANYNKVVGGGWETIIGRRVDQIGEIEFTKTGESQLGSNTITAGKLNLASVGEQIPTLLLSPNGIHKKNHKGTIVWIANDGKAGIFDDGSIIKLAELMQKGYSIVTADLFGQGEFLAGQTANEETANELTANEETAKHGTSKDGQRMWYQRKGTHGWERFSGYTYGYNHPLLIKRIHDTMSLVKFAKMQADQNPVHLVGIGKTGGTVALAARSQLGETVDKTFVDLDNFQFGQSIQQKEAIKQNDPMFVPGAMKYLGIDGLISLCAPHPLTVGNAVRTSAAQQVYRAHDAADELSLTGSPLTIDLH